MTTLLYANDASTTLQNALSAVATTATLAAGTGALFPAITAGQAYYTTFLDAATREIKEIVLVTARSGDTISIVRGQQNTTARTWNAGDLASQLVTAGDSEQMIQPDQLQAATYSACVGAGTANSITATLDSTLTTLPNLMSFTVSAPAANTGNVTLTLTLGLTTQTAYPILKYGGSQLNAGDIPAAGCPIELVWVAALAAYVMTNPASATAGSLAGGAENDLLIQTAPGTTGFVPAPTISGSVLAFVGGVISWAAAAVTSFKGRVGAIVPAAGDYTAAQVSAVASAAFAAPNAALNQPGFVVLPGGSSAGGDGMIIQIGTQAITPNTDTYPSFPKIFPNRCLGVVCSCNNQAAALGVDSYTVADFHVRVNATQISWIAIGY